MASSSKILLSVLIPVYRRDISLLLVKLAASFIKLKLPYEIIVYDDSADAQYFDWHASFSNGLHLRILKADKNKGRSASRNFLMQQARGSHCLLLDGDMWVESNFIKAYLQVIEKDPESVVVGGITYDSQTAGFRKKIGASREEIPAAVRQKFPYRAFTAANVLLPVVVAKSIQFDETIVTYGHEDTVFGLTLLEQHIPVRHIDNPAVHLGLEDDETYLLKIEESLSTLAGLWYKNALIKKYADEIRLLYVWRRLRILPLSILPGRKWLLSVLRVRVKKAIFWLDVYKLLYFHQQIKQQPGS